MTLFYLALATSIVIFAGLALWLLVQADRVRRKHRARLQRGHTAANVIALPTPQRKVAKPRASRGVTARIEAKLAQTGLRIGPMELSLQVALGALALYGLMVLFLGMHPITALVVSVGAPVLLALWVLRIARARYGAGFAEGLPEALDVLARGLRAGRPISDSLRIVVENATGPVQTEFARCHAEVCMGTTLQDSLAALYQRLSTVEVGFFSVATALQAESGGNLIETLENLADQLRDRRKLRKKARALSSEARASAVILAALPFCIALAIAILNGGYLAPLYADPRGQIMAGVALASVTFGVVMMARMGKLDV